MADDWESQKEEIRRLYVTEDLTCKKVAAEMKRLHGFDKKPNQYSYHTEKWGFRKGLKEKEWQSVHRRFAKRKAEEGKDSVLVVDGCLFPESKVKKALGRYSEDTYARFHRELVVRRSHTPEGVLIRTPSPGPSISYVNLIQIENLPYFDFLRLMQCHVPLFEQLTKSFFHVKKKGSDGSVLLNNIDRAQYRVRFGLAPLVRMSRVGSHFMEAFKNTGSQPLDMFMDTVIELCNGELNDYSLNDLFTQPAVGILDFGSGKNGTNSLVARKDPVVETLLEALFKKALKENQADLVQLLLEHTHIGPNDPVRNAGNFSHALEVAAWSGSEAVIFALLDAGADPNRLRLPMGDWVEYVFRKCPRGSLRTIMDSGHLDHPKTLPALSRIGDVKLIGSLLERATRRNFLHSSPIEPVLHWAVECNMTHLQPFRTALDSVSLFTRESFFAAIRNAAIHFINKALEQGFDLNRAEESGYLPLHAAVEADSVPIVHTLLKFGADANKPSLGPEPKYPLLLAVHLGSKDMVKLLLKKGADVNVWDLRGITPVSWAIHQKNHDIATYLIEWGANLERPSGRLVPTPLQIAAENGDHHLVKILLERGANVNADVPDIDNYELESVRLFHIGGRTALANAIKRYSGDRLSIVKLLVKAGACVNTMQGTRWLALCTALFHEEQSIVDHLLQAGASPVDASAFGCAAEKGNLEFLHRAISFGVHVDAKDNFSRTALENVYYRYGKLDDSRDGYVGDSMYQWVLGMHCLLDYGANASNLQLSVFFQKRHPELAQRLTEHGASRLGSIDLEDAFDKRDHAEVERVLKAIQSVEPLRNDVWHPCFGHDYLVRAAKEGNSQMVKALICGGISTASPCGTTALVRACVCGDIASVECLVEAGAALNHHLWPYGCLDHSWFTKEIYRLSPLQAAAAIGADAIVRFLLNFPGVFDDLSPEEVENIMLFESSIDGFECWSKSTFRSTASWALYGGTEILRLTYQAGLNDCPTQWSRRTLLQEAVRLDDCELVDCLLSLNVDVNKPAYSDGGVTALQAAAISGQIETACKLLGAGALVNAAGAEKNGRIALEGAAEWGRLDMVKLLLQQGADITSSGLGVQQKREAIRLAKGNGFHAVARVIEFY